MSEVTITFDVDGTLAHDIRRLSELLRRDYGVDFRPEHVTEWNSTIPELEVPIGEVIQEYQGTGEYLPQMDPITPACSLARDLAERPDVSIQIATHRPNCVADETRAWLDEQDIEYDAFYCQGDLEKGTVAGDALIDDKVKNLTQAIRHNVEPILVIRHSNLDQHPVSNVHSAVTHRNLTPIEALQNETEQWAAIRDIVYDHVL